MAENYGGQMILTKKANLKAMGLLTLAIASQYAAWAAFTVPSCPTVTDAEFTAVTLVNGDSINEPIKMATHADGAGNVDIYWVQRHGDIKKYTGATKKFATIGHIDGPSEFEDGVTGIALDPSFDTNHNIFLYYAFGDVTKFSFRISRFTLGNGDALIMSSEKIILENPAKYHTLHTGGAMRFDRFGDLWITTGENNSGEKSTSNTNDLRGKILRIHPTSDGKYTIPAGNLYPEGTANTRPEIYVMGARNPYSIALDPVRNAIAWGDVGPDEGGITEEFNYTKIPGFFGYPYFAGNNLSRPDYPGQNASTPIWKNTIAANEPYKPGLPNLKPVIPAIYPYQKSAAITGPIYYYNPSLKSPIKFPPHFDGIWFVSDFQNTWIEGVTLDIPGLKKENSERVFVDIFKNVIKEPIDYEFGPDGALYVLSYGGKWRDHDAKTALVRIEYKGTCNLPTFVSKVGTVSLTKNELAHKVFKIQGQNISILTEDTYSYAVCDITGKIIISHRGEGNAQFSLRELPQNGLYLISIKTKQGSFSQIIASH